MINTNGRGSTQATIAALYPDLCKITLYVAFEEADSESEPNYQQVIYTADDQAIFRFDCSRDACVGGGFDLTPVVADMVKHRQARVHGKLACEGALGSGRDRCALQAEYRIIIE